jgi:hypothetical protein
MDGFVSIDIQKLTTLVMIAAISTIGIVQTLKRFFHSEKHPNWAVLTVVISGGCSLLNTPLVSQMTTIIFNIVCLVVSVSTLGYQAVVDGIPGMISRILAGTKIGGGER